ncbi:unnamed protein product [Protopolystoma xenopodis]|uniref:Uncharacterized protein n=1 Tax=Protopolystoma xenopodis TaxID=117903 RepID=A0A448XND9_9PLAT|nr:unnamed protein product [Protopolystoma xenopodis]
MGTNQQTIITSIELIFKANASDYTPLASLLLRVFTAEKPDSAVVISINPSEAFNSNLLEIASRASGQMLPAGAQRLRKFELELSPLE